ncbi:hypothetical protein, partial [Ureibacillus thermosphaericus]|uniref:hypothetical protein n=1 Tax=Ureibacillus thermosphaericus TaxID=51173 RepID=UPI0030C93DCC
MKVVAANKWASVSDLQLQIDNDQDVSVLTLDDVSIKLLPVSALENDGDEVKPTAPAKYLSDWDSNVQKVESSNTSVLLASTNGTDVTVNYSHLALLEVGASQFRDESHLSSP